MSKAIMCPEIHDVLMHRDDLTHREAQQQIREFINYVEEHEYLFEIEEAFTDHFGLEPDYLLEILDYLVWV